MGKKSTSSTFVFEMPLIVTKTDEKVILSRMEAGRRLFNALLDECLKRLNTMRNSEQWQIARGVKVAKERTGAFKIAVEAHGFSEYAMHDFVKLVREKANWKDRLSSQECQKLATRVFQSVNEYSFGKRGRPRFKSIHRPLRSLEGKQNTTGIRYIKETGLIEWSGLSLRTICKNSNYTAQALSARTKFCRIVWRIVKGRKRYFVQLMQEGIAPNRDKFVAAGKVVGIDIGPSTAAIVGEDSVALELFAPSVSQPWVEMKAMQRKMDRSRRATNPGNFNENGTVKRGVKLIWKQSIRYAHARTQLAEMERKLCAARKRDHGELQNKILSVGTTIKLEKISHKSFQKNFGRSAKVRASGLFYSGLKRKAESAGGEVVELNTVALKMSQYDHVLDSFLKKPLSQRHHNLGDRKACVQRDIYSAFLARHASGIEHNPHHLEKAWSAAEPLLRRMGLCVDQSAIGKAYRFPTVLLPSERIVRQSMLGSGQSAQDLLCNPQFVRV